MLAKRVIPCLDVHDGQVTRGVQFCKAEAGELRNVGDPVELFRTTNRYRDVAINPNGRTIYIATDNAGRTTSRTGEMTQELEHPGAIIQFTYDDQQ